MATTGAEARADGGAPPGATAAGTVEGANTIPPAGPGGDDPTAGPGGEDPVRGGNPSTRRPAGSPARRGPAWWRWLRRCIEIGLVAGGVYALWHQRHEVRDATTLFGQIRWPWLLVAIAAEGASMIVFARLQRWLLRAGRVEIGLWPMVEITLAGNALAVTLPGGAAWSAGFAFEQLRRRGASKVLSVWVVLVAGALSSFAMFVILVTGVELAGDTGPGRGFRVVGLVLASIPVATGVVAWVAWRFPAVRRGLASASSWATRALPGGARIARLTRIGWSKVTVVRPRASDWVIAFGLALTNWVDDAVCLVASMFALGVAVPWPGILVAYAIAQIGASLPITPGGLGVVEGSLSFALIAYGVPDAGAVAAVLLYRVVSFWGLVPIGWGSWGLLELAARRRPGRARAHPWAWHES